MKGQKIFTARWRGFVGPLHVHDQCGQEACVRRSPAPTGSWAHTFHGDLVGPWLPLPTTKSEPLLRMGTGSFWGLEETHAGLALPWKFRQRKAYFTFPVMTQSGRCGSGSLLTLTAQLFPSSGQQSKYLLSRGANSLKF